MIKKEQEKDTDSLGSHRLFKLHSYCFILQVFIKMKDLNSLHNPSVHGFCCQFYSLWHRAGSAVGLWQENCSVAESAFRAELVMCGLKMYDGFTEMMMLFCQIKK